jgi:hypothetical protein
LKEIKIIAMDNRIQLISIKEKEIMKVPKKMEN